MNRPGSANGFCIGWDVGGWNCDHNPNSRDAIVILDVRVKSTRGKERPAE
jgi:hypothetical protein